MIESKLKNEYCRATVQKLINNARKKIKRKHNLSSNVSSSVSIKNGISASYSSLSNSVLDNE